ncbi:hypothetical protein PR048_020196 [Dryococelus australis]|uniref:Uncharacterized protein n=1 Tax=Dryococelus australis TaxID=614101 RepID=A0ABQ9H5L9_9NEOP|nr:hypothetical protein PR048_020196 [Dryococelus australis]
MYDRPVSGDRSFCSVRTHSHAYMAPFEVDEAYWHLISFRLTALHCLSLADSGETMTDAPSDGVHPSESEGEQCSRIKESRKKFRRHALWKRSKARKNRIFGKEYVERKGKIHTAKTLRNILINMDFSVVQCFLKQSAKRHHMNTGNWNSLYAPHSHPPPPAPPPPTALPAPPGPMLHHSAAPQSLYMPHMLHHLHHPHIHLLPLLLLHHQHHLLRTGAERKQWSTTNRPLLLTLLRRKKRFCGVHAKRNSPECGIPQMTIWIVLNKDVVMRPYNLQVVQALSPADKVARVDAYNIFLEMKILELNIFQLVALRDEAAFHLSGHVNKHYCVFWGSENPRVVREHERLSPKINVWCAVTAAGVVGPCFFENDTVNGANILLMLETRGRRPTTTHPANSVLPDGRSDRHILCPNGLAEVVEHADAAGTEGDGPVGYGDRAAVGSPSIEVDDIVDAMPEVVDG